MIEMRKLLTLILIALTAIGCRRAVQVPTNENTAKLSPVAQPSPTATVTPEEPKEPVGPAEPGSIDFKNLTYPIAHNNDVTPELRRRFVKLTNGTREFPDPKGGGATYELRDVYYVDLAGNKKSEAIVQLSQVFCGGSCDGGSTFFYFYSVQNKKTRLLSHIETGSVLMTAV